MSDEPVFVYRIRDWNELHETNRSRRVDNLEWFKSRIEIGTEEFIELMGMEEGIAFYGVRQVLMQMAVRGHPRGTLLRYDGTPHTPESIARAVHLPTATCERAVHALTTIGWLEKSAFTRQSLRPDAEVTSDRPRADHEPTTSRPPTDPSRRARGEELNKQQQQQIKKQQQNARAAHHNHQPDAAQYPKTAAAVRKRDPGVNGDFLIRLVAACLEMAKEKEIPADKITDRAIARAIDESFQTGPKNHGTGLLLKRVPEILYTWSQD
jgi:hypothetical protein